MNLYTKLFATILIILGLTNFANSQTVYTWNGSVSSSFSAAANWTPVRQIGLVTDILTASESPNSEKFFITS